MIALEENFLRDINDIAQIPIIPTLLNVICQTTGMGFAAIARVTEERWITCSVRDDIGFGLKPGDELQIKTTICNEIRESQKVVVIDNVSESPEFHDHHTPAMYGFQSYISVPIMRRDGSFFGTLCAIDPEPHIVNTSAILGMFDLFANLIAFHLEAINSVHVSRSDLIREKAFSETLEKEVQERTIELNESNLQLKNINKELESFAYISSHDLQEPLRKIQTISTLIEQKEIHNLSDTGKDYFKRMRDAANRMQNLINDLLAYSRSSIGERVFEMTDLNKVLEHVKEDLSEELEGKNAVIVATEMCHASVIPFQIRQLLYNLLSNSLKFARQGILPTITIKSKIAKGAAFSLDILSPTALYCHISVSDNGIGFEQKFSEKIFEVFQRLYERAQYSGTGIGLAIVKKIVDNHHGFIVANGQLGQGATFDIYIPVNH